MVTYDLYQVILAVASIGCVMPIVLLFLLLRAAILLERFLIRRSTWFWLIPISMWLARNGQSDGQGCCGHRPSRYR